MSTEEEMQAAIAPAEPAQPKRNDPKDFETWDNEYRKFISHCCAIVRQYSELRRKPEVVRAIKTYFREEVREIREADTTI